MTAKDTVARKRSRTLDVLVVDDSALMRRYIRQSLEEAGHTVRIARDGADALAAIAKQKPDVITLDVHMPTMDGLTCLGHIMAESPLPVVMVSSATSAGAKTTFDALELGAVDYIPKPGGLVSASILKVKVQLVAKVEAAARARVRRRPLLNSIPARPSQRAGVSRPLRPVFESKSRALRAVFEVGPRPVQPVPEPMSRPLRPVFGASARPGQGVFQSPARAPRGAQGSAPRPAVSPRASPARSIELVLVGVSTGGPGTLDTILADLSSDFPVPIVVAQHMPDNFTAIFAGRLGRLCSLEVVEITKSEVLHPGTVYLARGGHDLIIRRWQGKLVGTSVENDPGRPWHPSVGRMVSTALSVVAPERLIAVQLTGMGDDGAREMAEVHARGGRTIAQSEDSCVVYGMPRALVLRNAATAVLSHERIGRRLMAWV